MSFANEDLEWLAALRAEAYEKEGKEPQPDDSLTISEAWSLGFTLGWLDARVVLISEVMDRIEARLDKDAKT